MAFEDTVNYLTIFNSASVCEEESNICEPLREKETIVDAIATRIFLSMKIEQEAKLGYEVYDTVLEH